MLTKILLGFTIVCNFATLLGLWIAYEAAPATLQARIGHVLTTCGAIAAAILYFALAWIVLSSKTHAKKESEKELDTRAAFKHPQWETVNRRQFMNQEVEIDGKRFYDCSFNNVTLYFRGDAPAEFMGACTFTGNLRLHTDSLPAIHYSKLCQIFSSLPGMRSEYITTDERGNVLTPMFEVKELTPETERRKSHQTAKARLDELADDAMMLVRLAPKQISNASTAAHIWAAFCHKWKGEVIALLEKTWGKDAVAYFAEADGFNQHEPTGDILDAAASEYRELLYHQRNLKALRHTLQ